MSEPGEIRYASQEGEFRRPRQREGFDLAGWLVRKGIGKDMRQAEYIMLGVAVLAATAAFFLLRSAWGVRSSPHISPDILQQMQHPSEGAPVMPTP